MNKADYSGLFNDSRLSVRGIELLRSLSRVSSNSIQSISESRAEQKGYYRFLNSGKVKEEVLSEEIGKRCGKAVNGRTVLCIQDTTEINLSKHSNRLKAGSGVGPIDAVKKGIGFKIHPCLVVDASNYFPYGFAGIDVYHRQTIQSLPYHELRKLPIDQKESGKWIRGNQSAGKYLDTASSVIIIQDREGDIYEQFIEGATAKNAHLVIRCKYNRCLSTNDKLWLSLSQQQVAGHYKVMIEADSHKQSGAREALIEVRYKKVQFRRPDKKAAGTATVSKEVYVIEAKEITINVKDPIHWRLITTWPLNTIEDARQIIDWYTCRWMIEEVFRVLKKECYNIEGSELEQGWAIRKLSIMMLDTIIKLFQMLIAYNEPEEQTRPSSLVFEEGEIEYLEKVNLKMQGKTQKLSNPYSPQQLKGAVWVIARLGGWKGYSSQRTPGATTLLKGIEKFYTQYQGFNIDKDVGTR